MRYEPGKKVSELTVYELQEIIRDVVGKVHEERNDSFLRLKQVLEIYPVSKSHWYEGVKSGKYPEPVHLSDGITVWRASDIRNLISGAGS